MCLLSIKQTVDSKYNLTLPKPASIEMQYSGQVQGVMQEIDDDSLKSLSLDADELVSLLLMHAYKQSLLPSNAPGLKSKAEKKVTLHAY